MLVKINTMNDLEEICKEALKSDCNSLAVEISIPGREGNLSLIHI